MSHSIHFSDIAAHFTGVPKSKVTKEPTSPIPVPEIKDPKSGIKNQTPSNQKEKNLYPVKFMAMKSEAHLTGAQSEFNLADRTIQDILLHFGETKRAAIKRYREFVEKGIKQGTREDLQGGGLVRSAGGETAGLLGRSKEENKATRLISKNWLRGCRTILT